MGRRRQKVGIVYQDSTWGDDSAKRRAIRISDLAIRVRIFVNDMNDGIYSKSKFADGKIYVEQLGRRGGGNAA